MLKLGQATITKLNNCCVVDWLNAGSFLKNQPRWFQSESEAREFCRERRLQLVRLGPYDL